MAGRGSALQDDKLYANEIAKDSDLEKNPKGYLDPPAYVSIFMRLVHFFIVFHTLT